MKKLQKIIAGTLMAAMMAAPAGTVLADETEPEIALDTTTETTEPVTFDTMYGSQLGNYLYHQYTFEGEEIPIYESNFYFINTFIELSQYAYYGQAPVTSEGYIDLAAEFGGEYPTFGDYFVAYAENSIESTMIICQKAEAEDVTLTEDTMNAIEDMMISIATDATNQGMTTDEYLALYFGEGMDEAAFKATLEDYYLADAYSQNYCENYEFSDEDKYVPNIRYALFYAPAGSSDESLSSAEAAANDLLSQCANTGELLTKAQDLVTQGVVFEANDILVPKGQMVPAFEEWAYEEHEVGDMDVIKSDEYGYFVVGYLGMQQKSQTDLDTIALTALSEEISNAIDTGEYQFGTDQAFDPAPVVASDSAFDVSNNELSLNITAAPTPDPEAGAAADDSSNKILIVLAIVGGVAIVGVIVVLVISFVGGGKNGEKAEDKPAKPAKKKEEPEEEEPETSEDDE